MGWIAGWKRRAAMAAAAALVGAMAIVLPGTFAAGENVAAFGSSGILRLHLGAQDYFRLDPTGGGDPTAQTNIVPTSGCKVGLSNSSLVAVTVTPASGAGAGALGLVADGLGVRQNQEGNGTPCGQVNGTAQSMTIALTGTLADRVADRAELDIEGKFNVKVRADLFLDGSPFPAARGSSAPGRPPTPGPTLGTVTTTASRSTAHSSTRSSCRSTRRRRPAPSRSKAERTEQRRARSERRSRAPRTTPSSGSAAPRECSTAATR